MGLFFRHSSLRRIDQKLKSEHRNGKCARMLNNNKLIAFVAFLFFISSIHADESTLEIELGGPNDACYKYTKDAEKVLKITHARVLLAIDNHVTHDSKIVGNILCNVKSFEDLTYTFTCEGKKPTENNFGFYLLFAVTTTSQMLSGPIDYRYNENMSKLIANGFLDPENLKNQKFEHNKHIHIKRVKLNNVAGINVNRGPLDCKDYFPHRLIGDHGFYIMKTRQKNANKNYFLRMYYEPYMNDDYLAIGSTNW